MNFSPELGHFTPGVHGDNDADDAPCFSGPTVPGCLDFAKGGDIDFDGSSYRADWPDGTSNNATSLLIQTHHGIGPLSVGSDGTYKNPYADIQIETVVAASESTCQPNGVGCVVPPQGAKFYPFYALTFQGADCGLKFGNFAGAGIDNLGGDRQYGAPNLPWFFGTLSSGVVRNPCTPH